MAQFGTGEIAPRVVTAANRVKEVAPWLLIAMLALASLLRISGEGASRSFFNVYLDKSYGVSTAHIGILTALCQVVAGGAALSAPFWMTRIGKVPTVVSATVGLASGLCMLALLPIGWVPASAL